MRTISHRRKTVTTEWIVVYAKPGEAGLVRLVDDQGFSLDWRTGDEPGVTHKYVLKKVIRETTRNVPAAH